jgi:hypothetical protein
MAFRRGNLAIPLVIVIGSLGVIVGTFLLGRYSAGVGRDTASSVAGESVDAATTADTNESFAGDVMSAAKKTLDDITRNTNRAPVLEIDLATRKSTSLASVSASVSASVGGTVATTTSASSSHAGVSAATTSSASPSPKVPATLCAFAGGMLPTGRVLMNEIAWMGSPAGAGASETLSANNEWIELKNNSDSSIDLTGWQLLDSADHIKIVFDENISIPAHKFVLLERTDDDAVPGIAADLIYTGALGNGGGWLKLFDDRCVLVDEVSALAAWPAGKSETKQTLERDLNGLGWHTSIASGGTPRAENGDPIHATVKFTLGVSLAGDGTGVVTSDPAGIRCNFDCLEHLAARSVVTLTASSSADSKFTGWSGACSGKKTSCTIELTAATSAAATFNLINPPSVQDVSTLISEEAPPPSPVPSSTPSGSGHIVIYAVQITGGTGKTDNDFIRIFNPTGTMIDIGGWKLRKRTQSGGEDSIRVLPSGSSITAGGSFLWANSKDGFATSLGANESSTQTLAANNSIALINKDGTTVDAVAWGSGHTNPFIEGSAYSESPGANQSLKRKTVNGVVQDTDNNSSDFAIE